MTTDFCHLHLHSEYSILDGYTRISDVPKIAKMHGQQAVGLTDHGTLGGALQFWKSAKEAEVNHIFGIETYVTPDISVKEKDTPIWHLILLAQNREGLNNLFAMSKVAWTNGFYKKPRVDYRTLSQYSGGVIALSACMASETARAIEHGDTDGAVAALNRYSDMFPGRFYVELQPGNTPELNAALANLGNELHLPLTVTVDSHYDHCTSKANEELVLVMQQGAMSKASSKEYAKLMYEEAKKQPTLQQRINKLWPERGLNFSDLDLHIMTREEVVTEMDRQGFHGNELADMTLEIASRCENVEFSTGVNYLPKAVKSVDSNDYLRELVLAGLEDRGLADKQVYLDRMEEELALIKDKNFADYFLIVWDIINEARSRNIFVGPGRGSAAGSLCCYALRITALDPIKHKLLFFRFLDPSRSDFPDIDMDFEHTRRDEMKQYMEDKYGEKLSLCTYSRFVAKGLVRKIGSALAIPLAEINAVCKKFNDLEGYEEGDSSVLVGFRNRHPEVGVLAKELEGHISATGMHAAGVVVADRPMSEIVPVETRPDPEDKKNRVLVSAFDMNDAEEVGLIKFDFLGLVNLSVIHDCVDMIKERHGVDIDWEELETDDENVIKMLDGANSIGVFQMESSPYRKLLSDMGVDDFNDMVASNALVRPGAFETVAVDYIRRKKGKEEVTYPHEDAEEWLDETYGVAIFQEQVMALSVVLGGFSWAEANKLRKIIGKKRDVAEFKPFYDKWIENASQKIGEKAAEKLWLDFEKHANYSFNKCAHYATRVRLADGTTETLSKLHKRFVSGEELEVMSMWSDGTIAPHKVKNVARTGAKELWRVETESGKSITVTKDHRLLSTKGYLPLSELAIGDELITTDRNVTPAMREARRKNMTRLAHRPERKAQDERAAQRMANYQSTLTYDDRSRHQKMVSATTDRTEKVMPHMHNAWREKWDHDPEWRKSFIEKSIASTRAAYDTGPGYGHCSIASNGMWCASKPERNMCEWLIELGVEFEMHKVLSNGRVCDFYFNGIYWEMDGMDRVREYFEEKYGDLPFIVVTPEDFKEVVGRELNLEHAENGDRIVSVEWSPYNDNGSNQTFDIEMCEDGPKNFVTSSGIISHNSHAVAYSYVGYVTAWLKHYYPTEFMHSILKHEKSDTARMTYLLESKRLGIDILGPDVNLSEERMSVDGDSLRFGLGDVLNVGVGAAQHILEERPFESWDDWSERIKARKCNSRVVESLVAVDAFRSVPKAPTNSEPEKNYMKYLNYPIDLESINELGIEFQPIEKYDEDDDEHMIVCGVTKNIKRTDRYVRIEVEDMTGVLSCFGSMDNDLSNGEMIIALVGKKSLIGYTRVDGLAERRENGNMLPFEKMLMGELFDDFKPLRDVGIGGIQDSKSLVVPMSIRIITTKTGKRMAFVTVSDGESVLSVTFFPNDWTEFEKIVREYNPLCVRLKWLDDGGHTIERGGVIEAIDILNKLKG